MNKVLIKDDPESEMLEITYNGDPVFHGNYWDFNRDGDSFKDLLKRCGVDSEVRELSYEDF